jgi:hypothetical protein
MMKKSVFVKSFGSALVSAAVVGAFVYSPSQSDVKRIDISAFSNLAANINTISSASAAEPVLDNKTDVNQIIISQVENEIKTKIKASRYQVKKASVKANKVIAKNWNDIRPEFKAIAYESVKVVQPQQQSSALINNQELIKLYSFQSETAGYNAFANLTIESIKEDATLVAEVKTEVKDEVKDEVVHTLASTEAVNENATDEDMVMFDYSKTDSTEVVKEEAPKEAGRIFDAPLSSSVKRAIARELHKSPAALINSMNTQKNIEAPTTKEPKLNDDSLKDIMEDEDNIVYDYSQEKASALKKDSAASFASALADSVDNQAEEKEFIIKAREINLNTQKVRPAVGYEFVPDYDRAERMDDGAVGEIKVGYSLSSDMNTQTGIIQAQGMIPTRVELNLANGGMTIPLLNEAGIQKLLMKNGMDIQGNLAMVAVDPSIIDIELDSTYEAKIFFDNNFKQVDSLEASNYVLFLGVQTGNTLIRYQLDNKESAQKIIYIGDGEMYFEDADFVASERELFTFSTRTLLGKKSKELNVEAEMIGIFGTKTTSKKKALNAYELKLPEMVVGSRKYLEFKHMPATLYLGTNTEKNIEVPGMDFIRRVLQANDLDELGQRCIVQLNLSKDLRDIKVSGKNKAGEMFTETSYLDADGNFTRDNSELAEKVFIVGDMEGQFGAKLEYTDGSTQFLKTYCSEGSYLIEQL